MHVGCVMVELRKTSTATRPSVFDRWIDMYGGEAFAEAVQVSLIYLVLVRESQNV